MTDDVAEYRPSGAQALGLWPAWALLLLLCAQYAFIGTWFDAPLEGLQGLGWLVLCLALLLTAKYVVDRRAKVVVTEFYIAQVGGWAPFQWYWMDVTAIAVDRSFGTRRIRIFRLGRDRYPIVPAREVFRRDPDFDLRLEEIKRRWEDSGGHAKNVRHEATRWAIPLAVLALSVASGTWQLNVMKPWQPIAHSLPDPCANILAEHVRTLVPGNPTMTRKQDQGMACSWRTDSAGPLYVTYASYSREGLKDAYQVAESYFTYGVDIKHQDPTRVALFQPHLGDDGYLTRVIDTDSGAVNALEVAVRRGNVVVRMGLSFDRPQNSPEVAERRMLALARTAVGAIHLN